MLDLADVQVSITWAPMKALLQFWACRSKKDSERSGKRKRHHAEPAAELVEAASSQHAPAQAASVKCSRGDTEVAEQIGSPSKRIKHARSKVSLFFCLQTAFTSMLNGACALSML